MGQRDKPGGDGFAWRAGNLMTLPSPIILIAGPTAGGKSALALRAARAIGAEIVNADALQLYADLRVLSARPTDAEMAAAPHHLFGIADGADGWSVGRWLRAAQGVLAQIAERGRPAIVVGGTGLYFRALTRGLAEAPAAPAGVTAEAERLFDEAGEAAVREALRPLDPAAEARIAPSDRQRLVRALAVTWATGRALSDWQAATTPTLPPEVWRGVVVEPPRTVLYARCDARLEVMVAAGAPAEAATLAARGLDPGLPVMKAVGLRELARAARGETSMTAALEAAKTATRHYAKRQMTWFRHQSPDWPRIDANDAEPQLRQFLALFGDLTQARARGI
jgi:tRNA dimethylallyltransferase